MKTAFPSHISQSIEAIAQVYEYCRNDDIAPSKMIQNKRIENQTPEILSEPNWL